MCVHVLTPKNKISVQRETYFLCLECEVLVSTLDPVDREVQIPHRFCLHSSTIIRLSIVLSLKMCTYNLSHVASHKYLTKQNM